MNSKDINQVRKLIILECPTNLGLSPTDYASEPGVRKLPEWLKRWGFHSSLHPQETIRVEAPLYTKHVDPETEVRNTDGIISYAVRQSEILADKLNNDSFIIVLGGDCSVLIGSALALKKKGNFGLFYLDGHTDYILPKHFNTHGAAGMDVAIACGVGHHKLTNLLQQGPYLEEQNVFCVGNREYNEKYEQIIKDSRITYIPLFQLRKDGIEKITTSFLDMIEKNNLDGFFIHFDVDVLNDEIMPAVDSRQDDGLSYLELKNILTPLIKSKKAVGMEITILDPDLDESGKFTIEFINNLAPVINNLL